MFRYKGSNPIVDILRAAFQIDFWVSAAPLKTVVAKTYI